MRRPVFWSAEALRELQDAITYIADKNPAAARRVRDEIRGAAERLGTAAIGRPGRVAGTFEKPVVGRPYIIAYALAASPDGGGERVVILRVIHTARDWPRGNWPN